MAESAAEAAAEKQVMVVGIDDSEHGQYALQWTLRHFFTGPNHGPLSRLVLVHAKRSAASNRGPCWAWYFLSPITLLYVYSIISSRVNCRKPLLFS